MREVGDSIPGRVKQKMFWPSGRLGVRIMVWVGTSLLTRGVVFQWASTINTGRRSDKYNAGLVHTHQQLAVGDMTMSG